MSRHGVSAAVRVADASMILCAPRPFVTSCLYMSNNDHRRHTATCFDLIESAMLITDTQKRPNTLYLNVVVRKKIAEKGQGVGGSMYIFCFFFILFSSARIRDRTAKDNARDAPLESLVVSSFHSVCISHSWLFEDTGENVVEMHQGREKWLVA